MGIRLLGSLNLTGSPALAELSALAWDEDEQVLYALSDQGRLLSLIPHFSKGHLTDVELHTSVPLRSQNSKPLKGKWRDAEGLTLINDRNEIRGDSQLLISFERRHRIELYRPDGHWLASRPLPKPFFQANIAPSANKGMEAVTLHPTHGFITGTEKPPTTGPNHLLSESGLLWTFLPLEPSGALVALEYLPNGDLLLLERAFSSIFSPWVISLARIPQAKLLQSQTIQPDAVARFDSSQGWLLQNFEGLTRHQGQRFFMVSDDGNKPWAQTQLLYFELLEP